MNPSSAVHLIEGAGRAKAALHPLRRQILEHLREPNSASGLARRLGLARQKINYHLRELESRKLVELVEEKKKGNCVERIVRATAQSYLISPAALGGLAADPDQIEDRFSAAYLIAVAGRAIHDLSSLVPRAAKAGKKIPTLTIQTEVCFASPGARQAFAEDLANAVAKIVARHHDEKTAGGRRFRMFIGAYPAVRGTRGRSRKARPRSEETT